MSENDEQKQELAQYINFHLHPHASFYNTIEGIVSISDPKKDIEEIIKLLKKDCLFLPYENNTNTPIFLKELSDLLELGKVVFIITDLQKFDPLIYDQLSSVRENNCFNVVTENGEDLSTKKIAPEAKIFLVFKNQQQQTISESYNLTDHLLDLREIL